MIQNSCECGSSIKLCANTQGEYDIVLMRIWENIHLKHEKVSAAEARDIRAKAKREYASSTRTG